MHEMSLVMSILDIANAQARQAGARVINAVEIEVGQLAGVEIGALEFCFEVARRGTLAADAKLVVHDIPGRGRCAACGHEGSLDFLVAECRRCGEGLVEVTQGRELRVRSLNVD